MKCDFYQQVAQEEAGGARKHLEIVRLLSAKE
jgi:hypothetical protein